jgi:mannose-1-phosphate guanylyltransferase
MRHAVIMAGGAGVRLWPLSRRTRPKQALRLFKGKSLLRQSYERVATMLKAEQIHVITNDSHLPIVSKELPELPAANLIGEPVGRDTAAAVGLSSAVVAKSDPEAVIGIFTADHIITPIDRFCAAVGRAFETAEQHPEALVTMGITPTRPDTNYGYVWRGERVGDGVFMVRKFKEKPDLDTAKEYCASGEYYWNSGMFAWQATTILEKLKENLPQSFEPISRIADMWDTPERQLRLDSLYPDLTKISIDFAVMERAKPVLVVEMDCSWVDVGSWPAIASVIEADSDGNVSSCERVIHQGSHGNIVVSEQEHLVATIGVEDLVIVHSPDATLICRRDDATGIKKLVEEIGRSYGDDYL